MNQESELNLPLIVIYPDIITEITKGTNKSPALAVEFTIPTKQIPVT